MSDHKVVDITSGKPSASVVVITPEVASRWIAKNAKNRNIRQAAVGGYARDMAAGNWQVTGEAVKFDTSGNLIDGQHRLMAVIKSGASVPMFVVRGLSTNAQDVMDSGAKRQASDALHLGGFKNANIIAAAARLSMLIEGEGTNVRGGKSGTFTNSEIAAWVDANPDVEEGAAVAMRARSFVDLSPSVIAVAWMQQSRLDREACSEFWTSLINNATDGPGDPRNTLIRRLTSARRSGERLQQQVQLGFVIRAWNAWRKGGELHVLRDRASNGKGGSTSVAIPKAV